MGEFKISAEALRRARKWAAEKTHQKSVESPLPQEQTPATPSIPQVDKRGTEQPPAPPEAPVGVSGGVVESRLIRGDCLEVLRQFPDNTFTAVVTDPPYGLSAQPDMKEVLRHWLAGDDYEHRGAGFMGRDWDSFVPGPKIWEEVMRVLKPGGHILSFSGSRTYDLMVTAMRMAGGEVRDKINCYCELEQELAWVQGQGFPKSLDISKAIDKAAGRAGQDVTAIKLKLAELFDASGKSRKQIDRECGFRACNYLSYPTEDKRHDPWFCVLPSQEKWRKIKEVVGQGNPEIDKKLDEWFAEAEREIVGRQTKARKTDCGIALPTTGETEYQSWDVTVPATELAKQWEGYGTALKPAHEPIAVFGKDAKPLDIPVPFFYGAKVAPKERNLGCENLFWLTDSQGEPKPIEKAEYERLAKENENGKGKDGFVPHKVSQGNLWPTVKPIELARYLVRMVKMPGENLILDPFMGSGTTPIACEGCGYVGIDKDFVAMRIAEARIRHFAKRMEKGK